MGSKGSTRATVMAAVRAEVVRLRPAAGDLIVIGLEHPVPPGTVEQWASALRKLANGAGVVVLGGGVSLRVERCHAGDVVVVTVPDDTSEATRSAVGAYLASEVPHCERLVLTASQRLSVVARDVWVRRQQEGGGV